MKRFLSLFALLLLFSCSGDDDPTSGFTYNGKFYPVKKLQLFWGDPSDPRAFLYFTGFEDAQTTTPEVLLELSSDAPSLSPGTYQINSGKFYADPYFVEQQILAYHDVIFDVWMNPGVHRIDNGTMTISSVTETDISLSIRIVRTDGKIITGKYSGPRQ